MEENKELKNGVEEANQENTQEKKFINIPVEKNGRKFYFVMEEKVPVGEAYNAAYDVLLKLLDMAKQIADNVKPKEEAEGNCSANCEDENKDSDIVSD